MASQFGSGFKVCGRCRESKSRDEYRVNRRAPDGLHCWCRDCAREYERDRRKKDPERMRANSRRFRRSNIEKCREYDRQRNTESRRDFTRAWREANKEHCLRQCREYRIEHREQIAERIREWQKQHPDRVSAYRRTRRSLIRGADGAITAALVAQVYRAQCGMCAGCGKLLGDTFDVDHNLPLSRGGSNDFANLQAMCRRCNTRKGAKTMDEFVAYLQRVV